MELALDVEEAAPMVKTLPLGLLSIMVRNDTDIRLGEATGFTKQVEAIFLINKV
jgi:hypothetical protein